MGVGFAVILVGGIAILLFIIHGFWYGRQNREPLVRDEHVEENAKELKPTSNDKSDIIGNVSIVDNDFADELTKDISRQYSENTDDIENNNEKTTRDENDMYINAEKEEQAKDQKANKKGFWDRLKGLFADDNKPKAPTHEPTVSSDLDIAEPQDNYQFRIAAKPDESFAARDIVELCEKYQLELGENDIYYHKIDGKEVFRICANEKPYGFAKDYVDTTIYKMITLVMILPERGCAQEYYTRTAQCAFIFAKVLEGTLLDKVNQPLTNEAIEANIKVLSHYDKAQQ